MGTEQGKNSFTYAHREVKKFVEQVTNIVYQQLQKVDPGAFFKVTTEEFLFHFSGKVADQPISFSIDMTEAERKKAKSPFALDQWIWEQLQKMGITIDANSHYYQTINILSSFKYVGNKDNGLTME